MLTVYKSQIGDTAAFAEAVEAFRQAKLDHRFTGGFAPAAPHALVEMAVVRVNQGEGKPDDFVADYQVVDDTPPPPPPPTLEQMKAELVGRVRAAEAAALAAVIQPGKFRLLGLDAQAANLAGATGNRTPEQEATLAAYGKVLASNQAISRHAATIEAVIDDLTAEQIPTFTWPEFPI